MSEYHPANKPGAFLAFFSPRAGSDVRPAAPRLAFQQTVETGQYVATITYSERETLTTSADGQVYLWLTGDIYRPQSADAGQTLIDLYRKRGADFVGDLNGNFCLLLIDCQADQILIATDRENSYKLLVSWRGQTLAVSNSIYLQPTRGLPIDRAALACYLASGFVYNDRTLFEGVRMLEGASVYRLRDGRLDPHKYWRFVFAPSPQPASPDSLKKDMGDLLVEAVRIRLQSNRPTTISFSAGHDSRAVMGILAQHLRVPGVRSFAYAYGPTRPQSDESMEIQIAGMFGYEHEFINAYDGDAARVLARNGQLGGGMAAFCDEVDAWVTLGERVKDGPMPVMFTGDTMTIRGDLKLLTDDDLLASAKMFDFTVLSWLEKWIGAPLYREFVAATRSERETAIKRVPPADAAYDRRDMLRFDQIYSRETKTWREYFAARYFRPAHPFADNDVLDFLLRAPYELRRAKRLYIGTVTDMFPQLYALPHYRSASYRTYWPDAVAGQSAGIKALIERQASPLDDVIDPQILLALLAADLRALTRSNEMFGAALKKFFRYLKRANWHRTSLTRPSFYKRTIPAMVFFQRAMAVRSFLAEMNSDTLAE